MVEIQISSCVQASLPRCLPALSQAHINHRWSAHAVQIAEQECLIVMERYSGYVMVFVDLNEQDYQNFSRVWQLRLLTEAIAVADLDQEQEQQLKQQMLDNFQDVLITEGLSEHDDAQLSKIKLLLHALAKREGCLPETQMQEFRWGVIINDYAQQQANRPSPYQRMQAQWRAMAASEPQTTTSHSARLLH